MTHWILQQSKQLRWISKGLVLFTVYLGLSSGIRIYGQDSGTAFVSWSSDGSMIAKGFGQTVEIIDSSTLTVLNTFEDLEIQSIPPVWSKSENLLAMHNYPDIVVWKHAWDQNQMELLVSYREPGQINGMAFSPDGTEIAFASYDFVLIGSLTEGNITHEFSDSFNLIQDIAWSDQNRIAITTSDNYTLTVDPTDGAVYNYFWVMYSGIINNEAIDFNSDGTKIAIGDRLGAIIIWGNTYSEEEFNENAELRMIHEGGILDLSWNPTQPLIASAGIDGNINIWNSSDGSLVQTITVTNQTEVNSVDWSPDGNHLAYGNDQGGLVIVPAPGVDIPTPTPTETPASTSEPTHTPTDTAQPTPEPTHTPTDTPINTPEPTHTPTDTATPEPTITPTDTAQPTPLPTNTATNTPTGPTALYRIDTGSTVAQTVNGVTWAADSFYTGGVLNAFSAVEIANTDDDPIYHSEHSGITGNKSFTYNFPVTNGPHTVKLHFAEIWFTGLPGRGPAGTGRRVFDVLIENVLVLDNYDVTVAAGGALTAKIETFNVNVTDGQLTIHFPQGVVDNPTIEAIEIWTGAAATLTPSPTPSNTPAPTAGPSNTPSNTPLPTVAPTHTSTNTPQPTVAPTHTSTNTPQPTVAPTHTPTNTPLPTITPSHTPTASNTPAPTITPSHTPTPTSTFVPLPAWVNELAFASDRTGDYHIYRAEQHDGSTATRITLNNQGGTQPTWSPDHRWIIYTRNADLWAVHVESRLAAAISGINSSGEDFSPNFSPVYNATLTTFSGQIAFSSNRAGGDHDIFVAAVNLSYSGSSITATSGTPVNRLPQPGGENFDDRMPVWSPATSGDNAGRIAFRSNRGSGGNNEIYTVNANGAVVAPVAVTDSDAGINNTQPEWSDDGLWILFASNRNSSTFDVWAARYINSTDTWQTSSSAVIATDRDDLILAWKEQFDTSGGIIRTIITLAFVREPVGSNVGDIWLRQIFIANNKLNTENNRIADFNSTADDTDPDW